MVTNMADSSKVHMQCDKSRTHKPWGHNLCSKVFSTREEAEYHEALCGHGDCSQRLAVQLVVVLLVTAATAQTQKIDPTKAAQLILAFLANRQPRSKLVQPLPSEYHHVVTINKISLPDVPHFSSLVSKHLEKPLLYGDRRSKNLRIASTYWGWQRDA